MVLEVEMVSAARGVVARRSRRAVLGVVVTIADNHTAAEHAR
jgi:hypothetical protein